MNLDALKQKFLNNLIEKCGAYSQRILVAFSGGPDSTALLHLLIRTREKWKGELVVVHVNHSLRQNASDDEAFCRQFCEGYNIPFITRKVNVLRHSKLQKLSIEMAARELRYKALFEVFEKEKCDAVALGHHRDDQVETVLGNIVRGTGLRGLTGMHFQKENKIRPLLDFQQVEILEYLGAENISYRVDESNFETAYKRNKLRHNLLPLLQQKYNPQIADALIKLSRLSHDAEEYIVTQAKEALDIIIIEKTHTKIVLDIDSLRHYFVVLQKYILRLVIEVLTKNQVIPSYSDLDRIYTCLHAKKNGTRIPLHGKWEVLIDRDLLVFRQSTIKDFDQPIKVGQAFEHNNGWRITIEKSSTEINFLKASGRNCQFIDQNKIKGSIGIRNARVGDSFYPLGAGGSKSISNYFTDRKVLLHKRAEIPIVYCDAGIIWIVGYHLDERFKITNQTTSVLKLEFEGKNL